MKRTRVDGGENRYLYAAAVCFGMAAVCLALIFLSGCSLKSQQIAYGSLQAADFGSHQYAQSRGSREMNPIIANSNVPSQIGLKAAATAGVWIVTNQLDRMGHPRIAKTVLYTLNAVMAGVVVNNLSVAWGQR